MCRGRRDISAHKRSSTSFHRKFLRCPLNETSRLVIARRHLFIVSFCIVCSTKTSRLVITCRQLFIVSFCVCPLDETSRLVITRRKTLHRNTLCGGCGAAQRPSAASSFAAMDRGAVQTWSVLQDVSARNCRSTSFHRKFFCVAALGAFKHKHKEIKLYIIKRRSP